jgi:hypothetical protein
MKKSIVLIFIVFLFNPSFASKLDDLNEKLDGIQIQMEMDRLNRAYDEVDRMIEQQNKAYDNYYKLQNTPAYPANNLPANTSYYQGTKRNWIDEVLKNAIGAGIIGGLVSIFLWLRGKSKRSKKEENELSISRENIQHKTETQRYSADPLDKNTFTKSDSQIFSSNARWARAISKEDILQLKPIAPKKTELVSIRMWLIISYVLLCLLMIYIIYRREYS